MADLGRARDVHHRDNANGWPTGRCCDNGMFNDDHHCQKQPGPPPSSQPYVWKISPRLPAIAAALAVGLILGLVIGG